MRSSELDYDLPASLIAQHPTDRRDDSRLLVYDRATNDARHLRFTDLPSLIPGYLVVVNDTKVVPGRLHVKRETGGEVEILLVEALPRKEWIALARPSRRLRVGETLGPVHLLAELGNGRWRIRLEGQPDGEVPLPPYITEPLADPGRYQTLYARYAGSAAAPTAGLHFTKELLAQLDVARVTLHVGLDTFRPVTVDDLDDHELHGERYRVGDTTLERLGAAAKVLAVGTTTVRVLETLWRPPFEAAGRTTLMIQPGFEYKRVDALLTNFHLPRSTLLALVMAFAGVDETRWLYQVAIAERYRFYSFGDAMLIL